MKLTKSKGFTLIELLAVIVILAIILLIATPIILNIIDNARKGAFKSSVQGIIKSAENNYYQNMLKEKEVQEVIYFYNNKEETSNVENVKLSYKGEKPKSGNIIVTKEGKIILSLYNGIWCATKEIDEDKIILNKTNEEECVTKIPMPKIELEGEKVINLEINGIYQELGYKATSINGEDITDEVKIKILEQGIEKEEIVTNILTSYEIIYSVLEEEKYVETKRIINVLDTTPPILTIPGNVSITVEEVADFDLLEGVVATDNSGGEVIIRKFGGLSSVPGQYTITYEAEDESNNKSIKTRIITVRDTEGPVITIIGDNPYYLNVGETYVELGAVAEDNIDGNITDKIIITSNVINLAGEYQVTYKVTDSNNNETITVRTVIVNAPFLRTSSHISSTAPYLEGPIKKNEIESIIFATTNQVPSNTLGYWDVSQDQNGAVMAWYKDSNNNGLYELTIGSKGGVHANPNSSNLFSYLTNTTTINLNNFNTSKVINMKGLFSGIGADIIGLKDLDVSNVTDMGAIFAAFKRETIDISNWDTSQVTNMTGMFGNGFRYVVTNTGASGGGIGGATGENLLETIIGLNNLDTSKVTNMSSMFVGNKMKNIDISNWDTSQVRNMSAMFYNVKNLLTLDVSEFDTSKVMNMNGMFSGVISLTNLNLSSFDTSKVTDMSSMFSDSRSLTSLNLSNFDTSQVTNMSAMFYNSRSLTNLNLSNFDTSQVTNMSEMFSNSGSLTNLNLSNFDTSQVTNMSWMFSNSLNLTNLNLSNFDTSQVTNMSGMFNETRSLINLNLSNFDTSQVTNMSFMFSNSGSLTNLNLSNFDTSQVTNMSAMFNETRSLTNLNLSNFDTSKVTNMSGMFDNMRNLISLDLSNFDTSQVTNMSFMVRNTTSLISLDIRNATFDSVTSYSQMFMFFPNNTQIYTKNNTTKSWLESRLAENDRTANIIIP